MAKRKRDVGLPKGLNPLGRIGLSVRLLRQVRRISPFGLAEALGIQVAELRAIESGGELTFELGGRILRALDFPVEALVEANRCLLRLEEYVGPEGDEITAHPLGFLLRTGFTIFGRSIAEVLEGEEILGARRAALQIGRSAQLVALLARQRIGGPEDPMDFARQIDQAAAEVAALVTMRRISALAGEPSSKT